MSQFCMFLKEHPDHRMQIYLKFLKFIKVDWEEKPIGTRQLYYGTYGCGMLFNPKESFS